jgi:hypothetical protein
VARALLQRNPPLEPLLLARVQDVLRLEREVGPGRARATGQQGIGQTTRSACGDRARLRGALEAEDDRGLLEVPDLAHGRYVLEHEQVRVLDLARAQLVEAEHLRCARANMEEETEDGDGDVDVDVGLRALLLGAPLSARNADADGAPAQALSAGVEGARALLRRVYGDGEEAAQADFELRAVCAMDGATPAGAACQRAALLFALAHEAELAAHYGPYARDLAERVLPFVTPRFVANSCQRPDAYVQLSVVLAELWAGEPLGNWPRAQAHHNVPGGRVADA